MYYNYCAATAGTYCYSLTSYDDDDGWSDGAPNDAQYDVCPAGWYMPDVDEYYTLKAKYNNNSTTFRIVLRLPFSGYYWDSDKGNDQGYACSFWTSSFITEDNMYEVSVDEGSIHSGRNAYRHAGNSLRCIAH